MEGLMSNQFLNTACKNKDQFILLALEGIPESELPPSSLTEEVKRCVIDGRLRFWAFKKDEVWSRLEPGATVIFAASPQELQGKAEFFYIAKVSGKFTDASLQRAVLPGSEYKFFYGVEDGRFIQLSKLELNREIGFEDSNLWQGDRIRYVGDGAKQVSEAFLRTIPTATPPEWVRARETGDHIESDRGMMPASEFGPTSHQITIAVERLLLSGRKNLIFAGAPGTGKTVSARKIKEKFGNVGSEVQFHPAFFYEDFIEGLRPKVAGESNGMEFAVRPGLFVESIGTFIIDGNTLSPTPDTEIARYFAYASATGRWDWNFETDRDVLPPFFFIIDEMNRANLPRVFGEALSQIDGDKRPASRADVIDHPVVLPNSGRLFLVPPHVIVLSTMNTADRSIKSIDAAILRRFAKLTFGLDEQWLYRHYHDAPMAAGQWPISKIVRAFEDLNLKVKKKLEDTSALTGERWYELGVGASYFAPNESLDFTDQVFRDILTYDVSPYLEAILEATDAQDIVQDLITSFAV
jgi:hypothetical protein